MLWYCLMRFGGTVETTVVVGVLLGARRRGGGEEGIVEEATEGVMEVFGVRRK